MALQVACAATLGSCIAQLGDLRPGDDAGALPAGEGPKTSVEPHWFAEPAARTDDAGIQTPAPTTSSSDPGFAATSFDATDLSGAAISADVTNSAATDSATHSSMHSSLPPAPASDAGAALQPGCPAGTVTKGDAAADCVACDSGAYCPGGDAFESVCEGGTWDDDLDPSTPCADKLTCTAGQRILAPGDERTNRSCVECAVGEFSAAANAASCQPWTDCVAPSSYEVSAPTVARDRECGACSLHAFAFQDNAPECVTLVYDMADLQVVFEAERPHVVTNSDTDDWAELEVAGISAARCMEVGPDDQSDWTLDPFQLAPRLDYVVQFDAAGAYYVHLRGDAGASSEGFSDSCYAAIDGALTDWYRFSVVGGTWAWASMPVVVGSAGLHVVSVLAREDGFRIDKVVINTVETPPTGNGPDASPLVVPIP